MKFDEIVGRLATQDVVEINGGAVMLKKKVKEVIGGVPIFNIIVDRVADDEELLEFETIDELDDFSIMNERGISICRCCECGGFPEKGYYHDNELSQDYCSFECLLKWFTTVWGTGNWTTMITDDFNAEFEIWVKVREEQAQELDTFKKINGEYWRKYDLVYIPPYDFPSSNDKEDLFCIDDAEQH